MHGMDLPKSNVNKNLNKKILRNEMLFGNNLIAKGQINLLESLKPKIEDDENKNKTIEEDTTSYLKTENDMKYYRKEDCNFNLKFGNICSYNIPNIVKNNMNKTNKSGNISMNITKLEKKRNHTNYTINTDIKNYLPEKHGPKSLISDSGWKLLKLNKRELDEIFYSKETQIPYEYLPIILENLFIEEKINRVNYNYISKHFDINEKMRAIVINWICDVHNRFKLSPETLFLCVNLFDRYLSFKVITRQRLQLLGVTCLLVACKYEEIFSPEIRDFVCILDKTYDKDDIIKMEKELLKLLNFNVTVASSLKFFEILAIGFKLIKKEYMFGRYLLELSLLDNRLNKYYPSLIASTCLYMSLILFKQEENTNKEYETFSKIINYTEEQLSECAMDICFITDKIGNSEFQAIPRKFLQKCLSEVSSVKILSIE